MAVDETRYFQTPIDQGLLGTLGQFPQRVDPYPIWGEKTPTHVGYAETWVEYFVEPGERVRATVLIPDDPRGSGVVAIHQHNVEFNLGRSEVVGLAGDPNMAYGRELAQRGHVVIAPDMLGFEDRRWGPYAAAQHDRDTTAEKILASYAVAAGRTLATKHLSDLVATVSILDSVPEVDDGRIAAIGHSTGGQEALWLWWYDPRVVVAASSCGFARVRDALTGRFDHNLAMTTFGLLRVGDYDDLLATRAPKPFVMTHGVNDPTYPAGSADAISAEITRLYRSLGAGAAFRSLRLQAGHAFPEDVRIEVYDFLETWVDGH